MIKPIFLLKDVQFHPHKLERIWTLPEPLSHKFLWFCFKKGKRTDLPKIRGKTKTKEATPNMALKLYCSQATHSNKLLSQKKNAGPTWSGTINFTLVSPVSIVCWFESDICGALLRAADGPDASWADTLQWWLSL